MKFGEEEVFKILRMFKESDFKEMHLELNDLKLVISKVDGDGYASKKIVFPTPNETVSKKSDTETGISENKKTQKIDSDQVDRNAKEEGLVPIKAPLMGIIYRKPEPGASPYVDVGSYVEIDTTICLIEVMKVFNACKAGVRGRIEKICAEDGQLVEYGQTLFWVRPNVLMEAEEV